jgi:phosphohistidine phosphatase SixA
VLLVRHASAGDREAWRGDDRERPLDERGRTQAAELVAKLAPLAVEAILSSPYRRCVETVTPLAEARGLDLELREELGVERQAVDGAALVRSLAGHGVVVCGHGGLEYSLVDPPKWKKGAVFVVGPDLRVAEVLKPS